MANSKEAATVIREFRQGARALSRQPMMSVLAVLTLALGIGATTTIFTVVYTVLLKPLPYTDSHELVTLYGTKVEQGIQTSGLSRADFVDLSQGLESFSHLGAYRWSGLSFTGSERPRELATMLVTPGLLADLATPHLGRTFSAQEGEPGQGGVIVLSYGFWQSELAADDQVLGRSLLLDNRNYTVVGVMPQGFSFPVPDIEIWAPWTLGSNSAALDRDNHSVSAIGRLAEGVTLPVAQRELRSFAASLEAEYPSTNAGWSVIASPTHEDLVGPARAPLLTLMVAVVLVLAIACANVANLLLARGIGRRQEMALRAVLGAGRRRLVRQLLSESLLLAGLGGLLGTALAYAGVAAVVHLGPQGLPRLSELTINPAVLGFALLMTLTTGLGFGILPALRTAGFDLAAHLKDGGRGTDGPQGGQRVRGLIIVGQIALSVVLLVGAGLFVRSFQSLIDTDAGFQWQGRAAVQLFVYDGNYVDAEQQRQFFTRLQEELESIPGVERAAGINTLPLSPISGGRRPVHVQGRAEAESVQAGYRVVTPGYFETLAIPLRSGRMFTDRDRAGAPSVAMLNETAARVFFPDGDAVGSYLRGADDDNLTEIVGIVQDVRHRALALTPSPELFVPFEQNVTGTLSMIVETAGEPGAVLSAMQDRVWAVDPAQPIWAAVTMESLVDANRAPLRFQSLLASLFAIVALLLATIGLYGVLSYSVAQRTREIGLRIAVGADTPSILGLVLKGGTWLVGSGLAVGLLLTLALVVLFSNALGPLLFGVRAQDPSSFLVACGLMSIAGLIACLVPAWRACRIDPIRALRYE